MLKWLRSKDFWVGFLLAINFGVIFFFLLFVITREVFLK